MVRYVTVCWYDAWNFGRRARGMVRWYQYVRGCCEKALTFRILCSVLYLYTILAVLILLVSREGTAWLGGRISESRNRTENFFRRDYIFVKTEDGDTERGIT